MKSLKDLAGIIRGLHIIAS